MAAADALAGRSQQLSACLVTSELRHACRCAVALLLTQKFIGAKAF